MRDAANTFPTSNVAIGFGGVKKKKRSDFFDANYQSSVMLTKYSGVRRA
jgi:hypothetical protein